MAKCALRPLLSWGQAFELAGVEFTNGDQPGVRLTRAAAAHSRRQSVAKLGRRPRANPNNVAAHATVATPVSPGTHFMRAVVEFIDENGGGPGVRLWKRSSRKGTSSG